MENEKRNHVLNGEEDLEQEEDEKMEQFFALIRNFREARNRRKDELRQRDEEVTKKKQKRLDDNDNEQSSWVPSFEWADFTAEIEFRRPPIIFPSPINKKEDKKKQEEDDHGLDLNLAL